MYLPFRVLNGGNRVLPGHKDILMVGNKEGSTSKVQPNEPKFYTLSNPAYQHVNGQELKAVLNMRRQGKHVLSQGSI